MLMQSGGTFFSHVSRCWHRGDQLSSLFHLLFNATYNRTRCCSSSGGYRGEQDTADQVVSVKEHTRVEQMTDMRGQRTQLAS